jgi:hypothetical protein
MKVGQERKIEAAELVGKGPVAIDTVNAEAQNLGL